MILTELLQNIANPFMHVSSQNHFHCHFKGRFFYLDMDQFVKIIFVSLEVGVYSEFKHKQGVACDDKHVPVTERKNLASMAKGMEAGRPR